MQSANLWALGEGPSLYLGRRASQGHLWDMLPGASSESHGLPQRVGANRGRPHNVVGHPPCWWHFSKCSISVSSFHVTIANSTMQRGQILQALAAVALAASPSLCLQRSRKEAAPELSV